MNKFSNILKVPYFSDYYRDLLNKISQKMRQIDPTSEAPAFSSEKKLDNMMIIDTPSQFAVQPIVEDGRYQFKTITELTPSDGKFILNLNILEIYPQPIYEFVAILCQKCQLR
jgi:hypothetical protein